MGIERSLDFISRVGAQGENRPPRVTQKKLSARKTFL